MRSILTTLWGFSTSHLTKILGFMQVTVAVLAAATDVFSAVVLKGFLLANGLLVAWRGFFNSSQGPTP